MSSHGFGPVLLYGTVGNSSSACIVGLNVGCWLRMPHDVKDGAEHGDFFAAVVE